MGVYNGEGYTKPEANNEKAFQIRATVRPMPMGAVMGGFRIHGFWDADRYVKNGAKRRGMLMATFRAPASERGVRLSRRERSNPDCIGEARRARILVLGHAALHERFREGLLRVDHITPNRGAAAELHRNRTIVGGAYWFPHQGSVSAAILLDYEQVNANTTGGITAAPTQNARAVHGL